MGNCCSNYQRNDEDSVTYITYSDLLQDLDDLSEDPFCLSPEENDKSGDSKNLSFKVRLSKFKGKMF